METRLKILLIGKNGQVGWELQSTLADLGELVSIDRQNLDLARAADIRNTIRSVRPEIIVNAAAYTAVDRAESEPELAMTVNGEAPGILGEEAKQLDALLVHYSTDYVFDGTKSAAYVETDAPNPLNVYGRSKLAGERAIQRSGVQHLIFRTSWIYSERGSNFFLTVKRMLREKRDMRIVDDQIGAPTWAREIAQATAQALKVCLQSDAQRRSQLSGLYHLSAAGQTSWHGFAAEILREEIAKGMSKVPQFLPIATREYPTPARRPINSVLSNEKFQKAFGRRLPHWKEGLKTLLKNESEGD